jgi:serine/threonine protein kinase
MAEIYLARVTGMAGFEKLVVVKRILPQLSNQSQFIEMFLDEARIAATLQHPNIVQMYDIGAAEGNYFIAMEYLHGEDVRSIMRRLRDRKEPGLPLDHAVNIVSAWPTGCTTPHDKTAFDGQHLGIVHRDVTRGNVIVTFDGGSSWSTSASPRRPPPGRDPIRHAQGQDPYMSPEQCQGGRSTGAATSLRGRHHALRADHVEPAVPRRRRLRIMKRIVEHPLIRRRCGVPATRSTWRRSSSRRWLGSPRTATRTSRTCRRIWKPSPVRNA